MNEVIEMIVKEIAPAPIVPPRRFSLEVSFDEMKLLRQVTGMLHWANTIGGLNDLDAEADVERGTTRELYYKLSDTVLDSKLHRAGFRVVRT